MVRRVLIPSVFLLCVAALIVAGPRNGVSLQKKTPPADLDMSPMGRIAAGLDPAPDVSVQPDQSLSTTGPSLSAGAADKLVHSSTAPDFQSETAIAKNGNTIVVGYNDVRGFALSPIRVSGYSYSHDGGVTWTDGGQLPAAGGDAVYGDPDVKTWTDPNTQTVYFVYSSIYIEPFAGIQTMCVHVSTDGGVTWSGPRENTIATIPGGSADKEFIDIDPETGRLFMSWTNFAATRQIRIAYSDNMGLTWTASGTFNQPSGQGSVPRCAGNSPVAHVVWTTGSTIMYTRSFNNGGLWTNPVAIATGLSSPMNPYGSDRIGNHPGMDVDPNSGHVYVTYASRNLPPDFGDVYFLRSTDAGITFSAPVAINSSPGSDRCQFFPAIAADDFDQSITAMWYDQRAGTGTSDLTEIVHAHSTDFGAHWTCPASITDRPFHAEVGNTTSQPNIGDYNQCVSQNGTVYSSFGKTDFQSWLTFSPDTYMDAAAGTGPGPAPLAFDNYFIVDTGCVPNNGAIEPGETIQLTATIRNAGGCGGVGNVNATLTTTTPGINITSASATFPALAVLGSTSSNSTPFVFNVDPGIPCGTRINFTIDYVTDLYGAGSIPFEGFMFVGQPVATVALAEHFDGIPPNTLPAGWTSVLAAGTLNPWKTSTLFAASGANSVFCADIATTSHNELQSPSFVIPAGTEYVRVEFDETHNNELDTERRAWDGGVMRLMVNGTRYFSGGAGNMTPFYPWQMNRSTSTENPLHDLSCFSGNTTPDFAHYATDFVDLGGQTVRVVLGMSTDSAVGTASGQFIDNIEVTTVNYECECSPPTAAGPTPVAFDRVTVMPNPFNPETTIRFNLPSRMAVTAEVWSVNGARVRTLARNQAFGAGAAELRWDGRDDGGAAVSSGIYFVRVKTPAGERIARAVLLK
ncbi:MAG TPA: hypothetical protein VF247_10935 [Candidatus Krumholzibacteria bacterium]